MIWETQKDVPLRAALYKNVPHGDHLSRVIASACPVKETVCSPVCAWNRLIIPPAHPAARTCDEDAAVDVSGALCNAVTSPLKKVFSVEATEE
jgi:hypothetical protein